MTGDAGRIVVGYDASPDAELALAWALSTARLLHLRVDLVIAVNPMDPVLSDFHRVNEGIAEQRYNRAVNLLRDAHWTDGEVTVVHGHTVPVLLAAAHAADLLVVGSVSHHLAAGTFGGSTSQHLARHAGCPVVVVRTPRSPDAKTIVVGVDGSEESLAALRFAVRRATLTHESVNAIYAYPAHPLPDRQHEPHGHVASHRDIATRQLNTWVTGCRSGLPVVPLIEEAVASPAAHLLVERSGSASLVVVGSRGRDAFAELLLGSTSQSVLHAADCPVAVVR